VLCNNLEHLRLTR